MSRHRGHVCSNTLSPSTQRYFRLNCVSIFVVLVFSVEQTELSHIQHLQMDWRLIQGLIKTEMKDAADGILSWLQVLSTFCLSGSSFLGRDRDVIIDFTCVIPEKKGLKAAKFLDF